MKVGRETSGGAVGARPDNGGHVNDREGLKRPPSRHETGHVSLGPRELGADAHSAGLPSCMSQVRYPSPAPDPRFRARHDTQTAPPAISVSRRCRRIACCSPRSGGEPLSVTSLLKYARSLTSHRSAGWSARTAEQRTGRAASSAANGGSARAGLSVLRRPNAPAASSAANARPRSPPERRRPVTSPPRTSARPAPSPSAAWSRSCSPTWWASPRSPRAATRRRPGSC